MRTTSLYSALAVLWPAACQAWYLPGAAPRSYAPGDVVPFTVNALAPAASSPGLPPSSAQGTVSSSTQLKSITSVNYYEPRLHFCRPQGGEVSQSESLGAVLFGDRIYNSPIEAHLLKNESCQHICTSSVPKEDFGYINDKIQEQYAVNWMVDGLPVATKRVADRTQEIFYAIGFPLGRQFDHHGLELKTPALHNHYEALIEYHQHAPNEYRIVGATVWPDSKDSLRESAGSKPNCGNVDFLTLDESSSGAGKEVAYTITTYWIESKTPWATRWDNYLRVFDPRIHFFALANSVIVVVFLIIMVGMILARSVSRDIHRYNAIDLDEDVQEEYGWKLVHADIGRTPSRPLLLAVMVGTGTQLVAMAGVTLVFALLGFLSPSNRGSLGTVMVVTWTLFGSVSGYFSTRIHVSLNGEDWKKCTFLTAFAFPFVVFSSILAINFFLLVSGSSGAIPFGTLLALVALWFLISVPLTLVGSFLGIKSGGWATPTRTNAIPRQIPPVQWYLRPLQSAIMAGILPFGAAFLELFFVLNSLFGTRIYVAFGFLALTFIVTALTTATVTILYTYFALCAEDYRWHWRAFMTGGGSSFWLFAYGLFYWATRLSLPGLSTKILYLGYLSLLGLVNFLLFGSIGYFAAWMAVKRMYTAVRVD
ncbi:hypothetical protein IE81DRAFT_320298 [Ceraceosorus guamensis]|uniref:Transmembrane 9 superfamily member n=1 Tax=Ceraceosorus guamensis TaxID=1522189 RepID=A0A316W6I8_9BASI|nr:hypothetical protein IE81DRAFT_320298 [Ceraceosorus guamensis]PWN45536.1 hypothetical protein IE81DRAFT_320298 [Ceraceosorus guamensis]